MQSISDLCAAHTRLGAEDIRIIEDTARHLQMIADISQADVFIDCPTLYADRAIVVAQASPATAKSLYRSSVIGHTALVSNEPAVLFAIVSGLPVVEHRGVSQEGTVMQQNVVPIKNPAGATIGVLVKEKDITEQVEQEKNVELLLETTEHLSDSLLRAAMSESQVPSLIHEGILLIDERDSIRYANSRAFEILQRIGFRESVKGESASLLFDGLCAIGNLQRQGGMLFEEIKIAGSIILLKAVSIHNRDKLIGTVVLMRDITEIKENEKQLMIKSAVIKEIHHRVKNNLQTIASLLRMQMRRSESREVHTIFRESINRISSIAVIHEILAQGGLEHIELKPLLEKISESIVASLVGPEQSIRVRLTGSFMKLPSGKATTLSLIVTELLQNSILHGFKEVGQGEIVIDCSERDGMVALSVTDDGHGIGYKGETVRNGHFGLQIVETLVSQDLDGTLYFNDFGSGTKVTVLYPKGG